LTVEIPANEWWGACVVMSGARCRLAYGPADATATVSPFSEIQIGFTFLVPAHPASPGKRAVKRVCVCRDKGFRLMHQKRLWATQNHLIVLTGTIP